MDKSHPNLEQTKQKQGFDLADAVATRLTTDIWLLIFRFQITSTILDLFMIYTDIWHEQPQRSNILIKLDHPPK